MIVSKILTEDGFKPNIPEGLEYKDCTLNPDGETYTITFTSEQLADMQISPAQGRTQLAKMGKLELAGGAVAADKIETQIFWEYATVWELTSPTLNQFANRLQIDLKEFFREAKKIKI